MNTNKNPIEELINIIDPNTIQCSRCGKWIYKSELNYNIITSHFKYCIKCYSNITKKQSFVL